MNKLLLLILTFSSFSALSQKDEQINWRVIPSVTEWIEEINNWPDSIYYVSNIRILIDEEKDSLVMRKAFQRNDTIRNSDPIVIDKHIAVDGWDLDFMFGTGHAMALDNIVFKKRVGLRDFRGFGLAFSNLVFEKRASFSDVNRFSYWNLAYCKFDDNLSFFDVNSEADFSILNSTIAGDLQMTRIKGNPLFRIRDLEVKGSTFLGFGKYEQVSIINSRFSDLIFENANVNTALYFYDSELKNLNIEGAQIPEKNTYIPFNLIKDKLYVRSTLNDTVWNVTYQANEPAAYENKRDFDLLIASYKLMLDSYQSRGDNTSYNACYVEMRDKETAYYKYNLERDPSFDNFLTYQLNVFLRAFSNYGTKPTKAISFSIYVILFFALIYLFFPNSWDSHGRRRIMDRFRFFTKYMNKEAGIHEVYLEENKAELLESQDFKNYMLKSEKSIPKFFINAAVPLYKWSTSAINLSASLLKRVDIIKGTWKDLPKSKRAWKTGLLIGGFSLAIIYDLFIKVLNALMLSINTFTTLGFGEIPIKGLPRYLAIIQGFIGWFMLTIFSVSLISQLLN